MKLYELVKEVLTKYPQCRNDDKRLIWYVWYNKQAVQVNVGRPSLSRILFMDYMNMPSSESITRARRKIQELHPELGSNKRVSLLRKIKQNTKGTFIYRERI